MAGRKAKLGAVPFGSCLTGHHERCEVEVKHSIGGTSVCPCDCGDKHGAAQIKTAGASDLIVEIIKKHGIDKKRF